LNSPRDRDVAATEQPLGRMTSVAGSPPLAPLRITTLDDRRKDDE
jgi:hypothetical protein